MEIPDDYCRGVADGIESCLKSSDDEFSQWDYALIRAYRELEAESAGGRIVISFDIIREAIQHIMRSANARIKIHRKQEEEE